MEPPRSKRIVHGRFRTPTLPFMGVFQNLADAGEATNCSQSGVGVSACSGTLSLDFSFILGLDNNPRADAALPSLLGRGYPLHAPTLLSSLCRGYQHQHQPC